MSEDERVGAALDAFLDWAIERGFGPDFREITQEFMDVCEDVTGVDFDDACDDPGEQSRGVVFGMIVDAYISVEYESGYLVDRFLEERGDAVQPFEGEYLRALSRSVPSLYEVVEVVPKGHLVLRDHFGTGEPETIPEEDLSQTLVQWDWIFGRILRIGETVHLGGCTALMESRDRDLFEVVVADMAKQHLQKMPKAIRKAPGMAARAQRVALRSSPSLAAALWIGARLDQQGVPEMAVTGGDPVCPTALEYRVSESSETIARALDAEPDFLTTYGGVWIWLPDGKESGGVISAFLRSEGDRLFVSTLSSARADKCDGRLRGLFGKLLAQERRWEGPVDEILAVAQPPDDDSAEPVDPETLASASEEFKARHYRKTLDEPLPILGYRTPRELVKTAKGRRKVADWLKYLEQQEGVSAIPHGKVPFDFLPVWEELGIIELRK